MKPKYESLSDAIAELSAERVLFMVNHYLRVSQSLEIARDKLSREAEREASK